MTEKFYTQDMIMMKQGRMDASSRSSHTIFYCVPPQPGGARMAESRFPPILSIFFLPLWLLPLNVAVGGGRQWQRWGWQLTGSKAMASTGQLAVAAPPLLVFVGVGGGNVSCHPSPPLFLQPAAVAATAR